MSEEFCRLYPYSALCKKQEEFFEFRPQRQVFQESPLLSRHTKRRMGVREVEDLPTPRRMGVREVEERPRRMGVREVEEPTPRPRRKGVREVLPARPEKPDPNPPPSDPIEPGDKTHPAKPGEPLLGKEHTHQVKHPRSLGYFDKYNKYETQTLEPILQHKYGHLAQASYDRYNPKRPQYSFRKAEKWFPEFKDWRVDMELSDDPEVGTVLVNDKTGEFNVSYRGTDPKNPKDLATDSLIVAGKGDKSKRAKQAIKLFERAKGKYSSYRGTTAGHSLGGFLSMLVADKFNVKGYHFDPAVFSEGILRGMKAKGKEIQTIFRTTFDPVSAFSRLAKILGKNRRLEIVKSTARTDNPHAHETMIKEPMFLQDANTGLPILDANKNKQYITHNNTHYAVKKVPHRVNVSRAIGGLFDLAYVGAMGYEMGTDIAKGRDPTLAPRPFEEAEEVSFVPIPITFLQEGSIEQRALDALGKKAMGERWHTAEDINNHLENERTKKKVLYDGYIENREAKEAEQDAWIDRMNAIGEQNRQLELERRRREKLDAQHLKLYELEQKRRQREEELAKEIFDMDVELREKEANMFKGKPLTKREKFLIESRTSMGFAPSFPTFTGQVDYPTTTTRRMGLREI